MMTYTARGHRRTGRSFRKIVDWRETDLKTDVTCNLLLLLLLLLLLCINWHVKLSCYSEKCVLVRFHPPWVVTHFKDGL